MKTKTSEARGINSYTDVLREEALALLLVTELKVYRENLVLWSEMIMNEQKQDRGSCSRASNTLLVCMKVSLAETTATLKQREVEVS